MIFLEKFKKIGKKPLKMEKCLFFRILCVNNKYFINFISNNKLVSSDLFTTYQTYAKTIYEETLVIIKNLYNNLNLSFQSNGLNYYEYYQKLIINQIFNIIKKFYDNGCKIIAIGDDAQNIYQWRGSNIDYILKLTNQLIPVVSRKLSTIFNSNLNTKNIVKLNKEAYTSLPSVSFDHAISEKLKKIALIKANFEWNDLGTWESIWNLNKTSSQRSPIKSQGVVVTHNVKDSYINSDAKKTVAIDLKNIMIVFKNGQLLVANKNSTEFIKPLVGDNN